MNKTPVNRIYQGRVVKVELKSNTAWEEYQPKDWDPLLLKHHEIFQDAVNYYLLCFVALAGSKKRPSDGTNCPVYRLREQIEKEKWENFSYKGTQRNGMQKSVKEYLFPDNPAPSFKGCLDKVLEGNNVDKKSLHKALDELMEQMGNGDGAIQQAGPTFFPLFCEKDTKANFPRGDNKIKRQNGEYKLKIELLEIEPFLSNNKKYDIKERIEKLAKEIQYSWLANISNRHPKKAIRNRLSTAIEELEKWINKTDNQNKIKSFFNKDQCKEELKNIKQKLKENCINSEEAFEKTNMKTHIGLLYKHFPSRFTTLLMCMFWNRFNPTNAVQKKRKEKLDKKNEDNNKLRAKLLIKQKDPIEYCRGKRAYVFPAFTALPKWGDSNLGKPQWKEFDIAAFKEALTVIHQINEKTKEREKNKQKKQEKLNRMEKQSQPSNNKKQDDESEYEELPFIGHFEWNKDNTELEDKGNKIGDERVKRLRELLEIELAQEYFGEDEGVGKIPYGLKRRTLRGFSEIQKKWQNKLKNNDEFSEELKQKLKKELNSYQKKNKNTIGSAPLFNELLEEKNWIIWKKPTEEQQKKYNERGFSENPLSALCDWYELKEDIEKLDKPIQFTPADPEHSRRLFRFGDVAPGFNKTSDQYGHDENHLSFRTPIIEIKDKKINKIDIKIHYSAPRLFRDSLRKESEEELKKMPWLQPMMSALSFSDTFEQNFAKCNVQFMPDKTQSGQWRFLLNFPIKLEIEKLKSQIAQKSNQKSKVDWEKNCKGAGNKYLKWPKNSNWVGDIKMNKVDWFNKTNQFSCLSIDLGQRAAGAFVLIQASTKKEQKARCIASAKDKDWYALVKAMGLLRLPGEDMKFYQKEVLKTEPYGYKGRKASAEELQEAKEIISSLIEQEAVAELLGEKEEQEKLSFPELNDKLLVAIRRSQGKLSQYYRWAWMLGEDRRKEKALKGIEEEEDQKEWSKLAKEERNAQKLQTLIKGKIPDFQKKIEKNLLILISRIIPLRGRKWEWIEHPEKSSCHLLKQADYGTDSTNKKIQGQRGLSMKRIEQIEELRCRFQSLNQSQKKTLGEKPLSWSEMRNNPVPDPCPDLLKKLEELKKQRVNQTAHLILAEALGVKLKAPSMPEKERKQKDIHGEYEKAREPVNFIVIEDLSRYLTKQDRSPSENSRLMKWSHRAVTNKLKELCEPYGIPILEVPAAYSSKFCSRTGIPGFRAEEVTFKDKNRYPYKQWLKESEEEDDEEKKRREFLKELFKNLKANIKRTALVPKVGGPIFVPIKEHGSDKKCETLKSTIMQADINAAINVGLRAIASPLVEEIHHRIRSEIKETSGDKKIIVSKTGSLEKRRFKRETEIKMINEGVEKVNKKSNFFIDKTKLADFEKARIEDSRYASGKAIWKKVNTQQWKRCEELNKK